MPKAKKVYGGVRKTWFYTPWKKLYTVKKGNEI
jgi:hypothetical protein